MNIDTGEIRRYTEIEFLAAQKEGKRLIEINEALMTAKQLEKMSVSLHDTRSSLGQERQRARSKYMPHIGAKQLAKTKRKQESGIM